MGRLLNWQCSQTSFAGRRKYERRAPKNRVGLKKFPRTKRRKHGAYSVFGLRYGCCEREIRRAYHRLSLQFHPDKHPTASHQKKGALTKKMAELNEAYRMLMDDESRDEYDVDTFGASSSTLRVREHRRRLAPPARRIVSAMSVWRKNKKLRRRHRKKARVCEIVSVKHPNANNRSVKSLASSLVVAKRSASERAKDRRKGPFFVIEKKAIG